MGPLREVRSAHPTVSIRVVVDDLALRHCGEHNRVAQELELASNCMAAKLTQAGCEVATQSPCGQMCSWRRSAFRRQGQSGTSETILRFYLSCPFSFFLLLPITFKTSFDLLTFMTFLIFSLLLFYFFISFFL